MKKARTAVTGVISDFRPAVDVRPAHVVFAAAALLLLRASPPRRPFARRRTAA
jgi:hypothetical protein